MTRRGAWASAGILVVLLGVLVTLALLRADEPPTTQPAPQVRSVMTDCNARVGASAGGAGFDIAIEVDGQPQLLTHDERSYEPTLSPDHQWIAFMKGDPGANTSQGWTREQLWVMDARGGSAHPLSDVVVAGDVDEFVWSPDSGSVMYISNERDLVRVDIRTGASTVLLQDAKPLSWSSGYGSGASYAPSPDGSRIATAGSEPMIISLSDGSSEPFAQGEFSRTDGITWSPDGTWLVMIARSRVTKDPDGGLWAVNLDDGSTWRISENSNISYEWVGPDQLLNVRDGEGDSQTAYLTDLSEKRSTPTDVPQPMKSLPGELEACAR